MSININLIEIYKDEIHSIIESAVNKTLDLREANQPKPIKLYTSKQVIEMLGISESTFRRFIKAGTIKATKVNGRIRVKDNVLQDLLLDVKSLMYQRK